MNESISECMNMSRAYIYIHINIIYIYLCTSNQKIANKLVDRSEILTTRRVENC